MNNRAEKIRVGIAGASGYSGEELVRLLKDHPAVTLSVVTSRQHAGKALGEVFPRYAQLTLPFSMPDVDNMAQKCDVVFLALPHGLAADIAVPLVKRGVKVIDISADFRIHDAQTYKAYYNVDHPAPEMLDEAVYALPERYRSRIAQSTLLACPGCYPTSIILATAPLLEHKIVDPKHIIASSLSGVSGAGRKVDTPYLFAECNESVRAYGVTGHRHLPEIEQELSLAAGEKVVMNFIPHLIPVNRGIHTTLILKCIGEQCVERIASAYAQAYADEPFVRILPPGKLADTKHVTFTNRCEIGFAYDARTHNVIVTSCIDNLTKGAAGQAIQNMNICFGWPETTGLEA